MDFGLSANMGNKLGKNGNNNLELHLIRNEKLTREKKPYPLGMRSARPNPQNGAPDRKSFMHRVYRAQRGIETMV